MSAATTERPPAASTSTPLFTRHMRGAIEGERDRRRQNRDHGEHRYTSRLPSARAALRLVQPPAGRSADHSAHRPADTLPAAASR